MYKVILAYECRSNVVPYEQKALYYLLGLLRKEPRENMILEYENGEEFEVKKVFYNVNKDLYTLYTETERTDEKDPMVFLKENVSDEDLWVENWKDLLINNSKEHEENLARFSEILAKRPAEDTPEGRELKFLSHIIDKYEIELEISKKENFGEDLLDEMFENERKSNLNRIKETLGEFDVYGRKHKDDLFFDQKTLESAIEESVTYMMNTDDTNDDSFVEIGAAISFANADETKALETFIERMKEKLGGVNTANRFFKKEIEELDMSIRLHIQKWKDKYKGYYFSNNSVKIYYPDLIKLVEVKK